MKFDDYLTQEIGEFGRYQIFVTLMVCIFQIYNAINMIDILFTSARPINFRCDSGVTWESLDESLKDNLTDFLREKDFDYKCQALSVNMSSVKSADDFTFSNDSVELCTRWKYDMDEYGVTTSTMWDQVCSMSYIESLNQSLCMLGILLGMFFVAVFADKVGRKTTYAICVLTCTAARTICILAPNMFVYIGTRLVVTGSSVAGYSCLFILGTELVGPKWRVFLAIAPNIFWVLGYAVAPAVAWAIKHRIYFELSSTIAHILPILFIFGIVESPRWLYSRGKQEQADEIMRKIARRNGKAIAVDVKIHIDTVKEGGTVDSFTKVMKSPVMIMETACMAFVWITTVFNYVGNIVNVGNLGGNLYFNTTLSGLAEAPGYIAGQFVFNTRLGRKKSLMITFAGASACTLCAGLSPPTWPWIQVGLSLLAKFGVSLAYGGLYVYSAELYPTASRSGGFSLLSTLSRIGSITAPFIVALGHNNQVIPAVIFASFSLAAVCVLGLLPETRGKPLPQSLDDALALESVIQRCCGSHDEEVDLRTDDNSIYKPLACRDDVVVQGLPEKKDVTMTSLVDGVESTHI